MDCDISCDVDHTRVAPGQRVRARIILRAEQTTAIRRITATFNAEEKVRVTVSERNGDRNETRTLRRKHELSKVEFLLEGQQSSSWRHDALEFFASIIGRGPRTDFTAGTHEYDVEFSIPNETPPTFKAEDCEVFHRLSIRVDLPLKRDERFYLDFNVVPNVGAVTSEPVTAYFPSDNPSLIDRYLGKDVKMTVSVDASVFRPGDPVTGILEIDSPEVFNVTQVTAGLLRRETVVINNEREVTKKRMDAFELSAAAELPSHWRTEFKFPVDAVSVPTAKGQNFDIDWFIEIRLDVPWAKDPEIWVPVTVYRDELVVTGT